MQVLVTAVVVGLVSRFIAGQPSPAAIIIGDGLALSSTAVVLQVTVNEQLCKFSCYPIFSSYVTLFH